MDKLIEAYLSVYESSHLETDLKKRKKDNEKARKEIQQTKAHQEMAKTAAKKFDEEFDSYDVVLEYLMNEGYADTEENAITIMANMSEEWIDSIVCDIEEDYRELPVGKMMRKVFSKGYKKGRENAENPDKKETGRGTFGNVARMRDVAQEHDPEVSREKERQNRIRGRAKG